MTEKEAKSKSKTVSSKKTSVKTPKTSEKQKAPVKSETVSIEDSVIPDATENEVIIPLQKTSKTRIIKATSKVATELKDVWYSFEYTETREILDDSNMEAERQNLWDTVNVEVDNQVQDVIYMLKNPQSQA